MVLIIRGRKPRNERPPAPPVPRPVQATAGESVAARRAARMVTDISAETRAALRGVIQRAIREGQPPYEAARAIRELIGMNVPQTQAALNYRASLIDLGLNMDAVDRKFAAYVRKKIQERADTIA